MLQHLGQQSDLLAVDGDDAYRFLGDAACEEGFGQLDDKRTLVLVLHAVTGSRLRCTVAVGIDEDDIATM